MKLAIALAAVGLALAGCSSDTPSATETSPAVVAPATSVVTSTAPVPPESLADLSASFGCAGYADIEPPEVFVAESGKCSLPSGGKVTLYRFAAADDMESYWKSSPMMVMDFTSPDECVTVALMIACPKSPSDLPPIADALG